VIIFINYQKTVTDQIHLNTSHAQEPIPLSMELLPSISILFHQTASSNESSREHTTAFSSLLSTFFLSWSLLFWSPLLSSASTRDHELSFVRTNHPTLLLSHDTLVPAVHRVVLSAEICYESSIRIHVSGSERGVGVSGVLCGALMNVQSPVCW